jgi:hypothetical protein
MAHPAKTISNAAPIGPANPPDTTRTITAQVNAERMIATVGRYFRATLSEIIGELFQNARRAGSTRIDVILTEDRLVVCDNGRGIDAPETLLTLADTGWSDDIACTEDAAGAGFFALSSRQVEVLSSNFRLQLDPDAFAGRRPVAIEPTTRRSGTRIAVTLETTEARCAEAAIRQHARFLPVPVTVNGQGVEREDFLGGAAYVYNWNGVKIGVWRGGLPFRPVADACQPARTSTLDFHGLLVPADLPAIHDPHAKGSGDWRVHVQVCQAPWLKLVLPTRRAIVQDAGFTRVGA